MNTIPEKYDGIYFVPPDDDSKGMKFMFFDLSENYNGTKIDNTDVGDCWYIAFVKDKDGSPVYEEHFEAIFADPMTYLRNLIGANRYGCIVRKTEKSGKWFEAYLDNLMKVCSN